MSIYKRVAGNLVVQTVGNTDSVTFQGLTANAATVIIDGNLTVTGNAALTGNISGDNIFNGTTSIAIPAPSGNATITVGGTSNVAVFANTGTFITGLISATGNITAANFGTTGNTTLGNLNIANGSQNFNFTSAIGVDPEIRFNDANTTGALAANIGGIEWYTNDATGAGPRITAAIRAVYSDTNGNANILIQTGSTTTPTTRIAILGASGNVGFGGNVAPAHTVAVTGNIYASTQITAVGNIAGGNVNTGIVSATGNVIGGNVSTAGLITATGNITGGNIISSAAITAGAAGILATGNITGGNLVSNGSINATTNISATGNIQTQGFVSATGNVLANEVRAANANISGNMYGTGIGVENIVWQNATAVVSSASLANVGVLQFSTLAGYSYKFESLLAVLPDGSTNPVDYSVYFDGGTCNYVVEAQATSGSAFTVSSSNVSNASMSTPINSVGTTPRTVRITGTFFHSGNANVALRASTAAANLNIQSGSYLTYTRIG
jgi:filamentous hemagglutinin